ncbi:MAG TPA: helix-turn-helix domain-containing protein [Solirubrobacteraceae bacterium]|nr:helix-turn-helix domain-containing protein [Solirubrobacteraceae bacterium]
MHRVVALVVPDVIIFDLAIPAEIFGREVEPGYSFAVCTEHPGMVSSASGFDVRINQGLELLEQADTVIVPGFFPRDSPSPVVIDALRDASARGARVASVCVGAFALAAAGLLDGRSATTHWEFADELATRFPAVRVLPEVLYVDEGEVLTSAGIAAGIDLCLYMIRSDYGAVAATEASRRMVTPVHRPGGQLQFMERPVPQDGPGLAATRAWAIQEMHRPLTIADLARHAGYSSRTFARRFVAEVGITPLRWLTEERLGEARRLLEVTEMPIEEVARRCGLGTAANLRLHLARHEATTPTAYRRAFRISGISGNDLRRPVATS